MDIKMTMQLFFDRPAVKRAVDNGTRKALARFGGLTRIIARRSIRRRKAVSEPGKPPSSHQGGLKENIFFAYEPQAQNVVIGAALFKSGDGDDPVPALLEHGGTAVRKKKRVQYEARPFMQPAFEQAKQQLPAIWQDVIR